MTVEIKDLTKAEIEFLSDKCEKLEKQLEIAVVCLRKYADIKNWEYIDCCEGDCAIWDVDNDGRTEACAALYQIEELDK